MNDDELKSMIESAGDDMPASTKASIASAISAGFRGDVPPRPASSDAQSVVVALGPGGRPPRRTPGRWIAVGGAGALAAALIGVFALRGDRDVAEVTDTVPVETTAPSQPVPTATTAVVTEPTEVPTDSTIVTTESATTGSATTETATTESATTSTGVVVNSSPQTSVSSPSPVTNYWPADVIPFSVSFPTTSAGWIVEGGPDADLSADRLLHTSDGGMTWALATSPPLNHGPFTVEFADAENGWIVGTLDNGDGVAYSSHDGGESWNPIELTGTDGSSVRPMSVGSSDSTVSVLAAGVSDAAGTAPAFRLFTSPISTDAFTESPVVIDPGAGPVFDAQFAFATRPDGSQAGWLVYNDRGYQAGARLVGSQWVEWEAPCVDGGDASLAANSDGSTLLVGCSPTGFEGTLPPIAFHLSHDGGGTFSGTVTPPNAVPDPASGPLPSVAFIAAPGPAIVVGYTASDGRAAVVRSTDDGATWQPSVGASFVGPLTAIPGDQPLLLMTSIQAAGVAIISADGGATWGPVATVPVG